MAQVENWRTQVLHREREFYEGKKEDHELLEKVIGGETSFSEELENIIHKMNVVNPQKEFNDYVGLMQELGAYYLDADDLEKRASALIHAGAFELAYGTSILAVGIASIAFLVPPFALAEPIIAAVGGSGIAALKKKMDYIRETKEHKDYYFQDLRGAAAYFDLDIGRHFLFEHFRDNREAFERTYDVLQEEEREEAAKSLKGWLDAGLLEMGEVELDQYLLSLEEKEEE